MTRTKKKLPARNTTITMPRKKATKAAKKAAGPKRNWKIQTEPHEALPALILRYLLPNGATTFDLLFQSVWDDLCECVFWTRRETGEQDAKVFMHGLGSSSMARRRECVREDMRSALAALIDEGAVKTGTTARTADDYWLVSYEARADWLASRPPALMTLYKRLRMAGCGSWDNATRGLDRFLSDGTLKDTRDEEIRQLKLERDRLKIDLESANALLKVYTDAAAKRRQLTERPNY